MLSPYLLHALGLPSRAVRKRPVSSIFGLSMLLRLRLTSDPSNAMFESSMLYFVGLVRNAILEF